MWIYCILCWFIQDAAKVGTYRLLRKYNVFQINTIVKSKLMDSSSSKGTADEEV